MEEKKIIKRVLGIIDAKQKDIAAFLQDIIKIPSVNVTGKEKKCQEFIGSKFNELGLKVDMWEPNWEEVKKHPAYVPVEEWYSEYKGFKNRPIVVGVHKGSGKGRSLLFNGHIDVVSPGLVGDWTKDPWSGELENGRIYGRGTADMKAGVVAMISALEAVLETGITLKGDVILESVLDEESGGNGTIACLQRGYKADAGIFTEPSELEIVIAHTGHQMFKIEVEGKASHIGFKDEGVDAILKAQKIMEKVYEWEQARCKIGLQHPLYKRWSHGGCAVVIGECQGGEYITSTARKCVLKGLYQTLPGEDVKGKLNNELKEVVNCCNYLDPWLRKHPAKFTPFGMWYEGAEISSDNPIVTTLSKAFYEVLQKNPIFTGMPTGCDMRIYTNRGDTPSFIFGPGSIRCAHSVDEYVKVEELIKATKVLAITILKWCEIS